MAVCTDDLFWEETVKYSLGEEVAFYKPNSECYQIQYLTLRDINSIQEAITSGRVDALIYFLDMGEELTGDLLAQAIVRGNLSQLKYLRDVGAKFNTQHVIYAAYSGHVDILDFLEDAGVPSDNEGVNYGAHHDNVLDWYANRGIKPEMPKSDDITLYISFLQRAYYTLEELIDHAIVHHHINVLSNIPYSFTQEKAVLARELGDNELADWIEARV